MIGLEMAYALSISAGVQALKSGIDFAIGSTEAFKEKKTRLDARKACQEVQDGWHSGKKNRRHIRREFKFYGAFNP